MLGRELLVLRGLDIVPLLFDWDRQAFDLSAGYLLELGLPAFDWPGNEQENQAVPGFAKLMFSCTLHTPTIAEAQIG